MKTSKNCKVINGLYNFPHKKYPILNYQQLGKGLIYIKLKSKCNKTKLQNYKFVGRMFEALKSAIKLNSYIDGKEALSNTYPVAKFYFGCHEKIYNLILKMKNSCSNCTKIN